MKNCSEMAIASSSLTVFCHRLLLLEKRRNDVEKLRLLWCCRRRECAVMRKSAQNAVGDYRCSKHNQIIKSKSKHNQNEKRRWQNYIVFRKIVWQNIETMTENKHGWYLRRKSLSRKMPSADRHKVELCRNRVIDAAKLVISGYKTK